MTLNSRSRCKICGSTNQTFVDHFGSVPLVLNVVYDTFQAARAAETGTVALARCETCGFVWNSRYEPSLVKFEKSYENAQDHSATFARHVAAAARAVVEATSRAYPIRYLELGCGQGFFLRQIIELLGARLQTAEAFDPAWHGSPITPPTSDVRIYDTHFDAGRIRHRPNLIVMRHSFEYFSDPIDLLRTLRKVSDEPTLLFVETPSVVSMFKRGAIEDFGYERQHFFDQKSLSFALEQAGWRVREQKTIFSDQYIWLFGTTESVGAPVSVAEHIAIPSSLAERYRARWLPTLRAARQDGKVAIWGTGAKGTMFSVLNDPDRAYLDCGIDINPHRRGKFIPVSGLPIVSPTEAGERGLGTIFVMNPAYLNEIRAQAAESGIKARILAHEP